jgi:hypothetical protein
MKRKLAFAMLPVMAAVVASCTTITPESSSSANIKHGVPGGEFSRDSQIKATVTGIDHGKRRLTMVTPDSKKFQITAGPEVVNFDQIRIGDQLRVTLNEHLVIRMALPGEKVKEQGGAQIDLAKIGAKPGAAVTGSVQVVTTVTAIDAKKHKATLQFSDGSTETVSVRQDIDLAKHKIGEKVVIRYAERFAVKIEKP